MRKECRPDDYEGLAVDGVIKFVQETSKSFNTPPCYRKQFSLPQASRLVAR